MRSAEDAVGPGPEAGSLTAELRGRSPDDVYEAMAEWAGAQGLTLYPHQEEALLAILTGSHLVLSSPTGSGKSLVALGAHAAAIAKRVRTYYTAPIKALVSEKFFGLVDVFGPEQVGMVTGDAAINSGAPIICCTAEILANQALREGSDGTAGDAVVVMDEFHYYADPQRGWAWQVPLLELPRAQFVLMSATLGDMSFLAEDLRRRTGRDVTVIDDAERPIPLEFDYSIEPLQDLLVRLVRTERSPAYVVHFTQAAAVERAQSLTSVALATRAQRDAIVAEIGAFRFSPGFGATLSRLLRAGIGVHHAGMLPRYRRLVERLTQRGLLKVICGTDTLGVGINVPIRTVVITALTKYDGVRSRHLTAREFHQVAGRAGRAGFDTRGDVIVQAPDHVIENAKALAKAGDDERKRRRIVRKKAPPGVVNWTDKTFERLRDSAPEPLTSQFHVSHAMVLDLLARPGDAVAAMARLLRENHEPPTDRDPHLRRAVAIYRTLRAGGIVERLSAPDPSGRRVRLTVDLPDDFALNTPLAPFALAALEILDRDAPTYALDVVSVIESTLEDPRPVVVAQEKAARRDAVATMKADGIEYDERMELLADVTHPRPLAEPLFAALAAYRTAHPWVADYELRPKSVVREMAERAQTFAEFVSGYGLARSEGILLRYLTDAYRALRQVVPEQARNEELADLIEWLGELVRSVDSSLLAEWEALTQPAGAIPAPAHTSERAESDEPGPVTANQRAFRVLVRNAMFHRVELAARSDFTALAAIEGPLTDLESPARRGEPGWAPADFEDALRGYWAEYDHIGIDASARASALVTIQDHGRRWLVRQVLDDPDKDHDWAITAEVDLDASDTAGAVVARTLAIAPLP